MQVALQNDITLQEIEIISMSETTLVKYALVKKSDAAESSKLNLISSLSATHTIMKHHWKFKIKSNIFTFHDVQEPDVAKKLKLKLISSLSATHKNQTSRKV